MNKIRLLIVDDSIFMRQTLKKLLQSEEIEVIFTARNGKEGVEKAIELKPDVITMDIEMPVMTGLEAVREIMKLNPTPIIMVSTLTMEGAAATIEALSDGAVDFITKKANFTELSAIKNELTAKIKAVGGSNVLKNKMIRNRLLRRMSKPGKETARQSATRHYKAKSLIPNYQEFILLRRKPKKQDIKAIGIGISTGGPAALKDFLIRLPKGFPVPIFIAQHMPKNFTKTLADRLNSISDIEIVEAAHSDKARPGCVYIAPGGRQMLVTSKMRIKITDDPQTSLYKPSVDVMFNSLNKVFGSELLGIMMTGMGNDGLEGFKTLSKNGGYIIAQDINSCVVSGMTKSVIEAKIANEVVSLSRLANVLCKLFDLELNI